MVDYGHLAQLAATGRNPAQETEYQNALRDAGFNFTVDNGKTNVAGFGVGGNGTGDQATAFFTPQNLTNMQTQQKAQQAIDASNAKFDTLVGQGRQDVTSFLSKFATDVPSIVTATQNKYQIPQQVDLVSNLNKRISELQTNSNNEGAGGYASAGQVDAAVNSRYLPQLNTAVSNLNTSETAAQGESAQLLQPDITEGTLLNDRLAREMTGFSAEQQTTLGSLMDMLSQGTQLTETQLKNANDLAVAKLSYDTEMARLNAPQNRIVAVPAGDKVFQVSPTGTTTGSSTQPLSLSDLSSWIKANSS